MRGIDNEKIVAPYFYRNVHQSVDSLISDAGDHFETTSNGKIAGFIVEPVMGAGGIIPLP